MCGIAGSVGMEMPERVLDALAHRGPDGKGLKRIAIAGKTVYLGHTRLAILDLSQAGQQPMGSRDQRWWVAFNGEIYNHLALREELGRYGRRQWRGHSDTETLIELLALEGIDRAVKKLNGMFAFAAVDRKEAKLYLVRDPIGIKPLYYWQGQERVAFASEVRALRAMGIPLEVSREGVRQFLTLRYVPSPGTMWKGVRRLAPGHVLCVDLRTGNGRTVFYGAREREPFSGSIEDAVKEYREQLVRAVRRQLLSDVPVGVLLSGGVDSALVAAVARDVGRKLPCFSVGFGPAYRECEIRDAAGSARALGLRFHPVEVSADQLRVALPKVVAAVEEPLGTTSVMPMWYLAERARKDVTVVLTGQGTDEPWGGYRKYQMELIRRLVPWARLWEVLEKCGRRLGSLPEVVERGLRGLSQRELANRAVEAAALFPAADRRWLLDDGGDEDARRIVERWMEELGIEADDGVAGLMRLDTRMNLADDLLLYGDKISMAFSLETRVPMLDLDLVEFVESLPVHYRIRLGRGKVVHKMLARSYLPERIVQRRKRGFMVPFGKWCRGRWREWVEEKLLGKSRPHLSVLKVEGVERTWRAHVDGRRDQTRQLFALLMLALWWELQEA